MKVRVAVDPESVEPVAELLAGHGARVTLRARASAAAASAVSGGGGDGGDDDDVVELRAELDASADLPAIERALWYLGRLGRVGPLELLPPRPGAIAARDARGDGDDGGDDDAPLALPVAPGLWVGPRGARNVPPGERVIDLATPGGAFGTGLHPATALCLAWLGELPVAGRRVLDAGAGSGILAVVAAWRGAARVDAVELDAAAMGALEDNLGRNGVSDRVRAVHGDAGDPACLPAGSYELVLANLTASVLAQVAPALARAAAPGATLLLGGILAAQEAAVTRALEAAGCAVQARRTRGDWVALCAARSR